MTSVVLDANALIMPFQFSVNLDSEIIRLVGEVDIFVPSSVIDELERLGRKDALKLASKYEVIFVSKKGDRGVVEAVEKTDGILVTNDKILKERVLKKKKPVITLRSRSHLELVGDFHD